VPLEHDGGLVNAGGQEQPFLVGGKVRSRRAGGEHAVFPVHADREHKQARLAVPQRVRDRVGRLRRDVPGMGSDGVGDLVEDAVSAGCTGRADDLDPAVSRGGGGATVEPDVHEVRRHHVQHHLREALSHLPRAVVHPLDGQRGEGGQVTNGAVHPAVVVREGAHRHRPPP
jgi:hypothetical protein